MFSRKSFQSSLPEQAVTFYAQKPKRYNCAQAVAKAFERNDLVESLQFCGGGKAPEGLCGALYAAMLLAGEERDDVVKEKFLEEIGHLECKVIRKNGQVTCTDCVRRSAEIVELTTGDNP